MSDTEIRNITLHLPDLQPLEGRQVIAHRTHRAAVTRLLKNGYRKALPSFDRKLLKSYPTDTYVIVGTEEGRLVPVITAAIEVARSVNALDERLEVDPRGLFGNKRVDDIEFPVAVVARATTSIKGLYPQLRPAVLNLASALGCRAQSGFNLEVNGIAASLKPYGYQAIDVPDHLAERAIHKGPHVVTWLGHERFRVVAADLLAFHIQSRLRRLRWSPQAERKLVQLGGTSWL